MPKVEIETFTCTITDEFKWRVWTDNVGMLFTLETAARDYLWQKLKESMPKRETYQTLGQTNEFYAKKFL